MFIVSCIGCDDVEKDKEESEEKGNEKGEEIEDSKFTCDYNWICRFICLAAITTKSAEVVIQCAFNAHRMKEVSRQQLQSAARRFKLQISSKNKASLLIPVAAALIKNQIVKVASWLGDYSNLTRMDVCKMSVF